MSSKIITILIGVTFVVVGASVTRSGGYVFGGGFIFWGLFLAIPPMLRLYKK